MKITTTLPLLATLGLAAAASADITGVFHNDYIVTTEDFGGSVVTLQVQDLYLTSDDASDVVLNVFNLNLPEMAQVDYYQSVTGTGWLPNNLGGIFDTPALRAADSFVTIGGFDQNVLAPEQSPGAGAGTGLDPNFGGNNAAMPGVNAGWFNSSPPNVNGQVGQIQSLGGGFTLGVLIGRFASYDGPFPFCLEGGLLEVTWNQGLGTPGQQGSFAVVPAPGAIALLGLGGLAGRRRRAGA